MSPHRTPRGTDRASGRVPHEGPYLTSGVRVGRSHSPNCQWGYTPPGTPVPGTTEVCVGGGFRVLGPRESPHPDHRYGDRPRDFACGEGKGWGPRVPMRGRGAGSGSGYETHVHVVTGPGSRRSPRERRVDITRGRPSTESGRGSTAGGPTVRGPRGSPPEAPDSRRRGTGEASLPPAPTVPPRSHTSLSPRPGPSPQMDRRIPTPTVSTDGVPTLGVPRVEVVTVKASVTMVVTSTEG